MVLALLQKYHKELQNLDRTRKRMELLHRQGRISLRDIHIVYESLFLRAVVGFELYCDTLFYRIIHGEIRYSVERVACKITAESKKAMREVIFRGEKRYLEWLPYWKAEDTAKLYLREGRPFTLVDGQQKGMLFTIVTIRHAIAHSSDKALGDFQKKVIGSIPLLPRERSPAGFLRSRMSGRAATTRFEAYISELGSIAVTILDRPKR